MYISDNIRKHRPGAGLRPILAVAAAAVLSATMQSCLSDEGIPYPNIQANFATFDVRFQERPAQIDTINRCVTVYLNDSADIAAVNVRSYTFNRPDASLVDPSALSGSINLSDSFDVALKVYREYLWTITARQTISRWFAVANQIGASSIDDEAHTVSAVVPDKLPLTAVRVDSIKLGGATAVMTPDLQGKTVDFTEPVTVEVTEHGETTTWTITVTQTSLSVDITAVDPWTGIAWVTAAAQAGDDVSFSYRPTGTLQWLPVPATDVEADGAVFIARLSGLIPESDYEVIAECNGQTTLPVSFTTGTARQLPNSDFRNWWLDNKVWCPWAEGGEQFWDTGNKGAATLGQSNVLPYDDASSPTGYGGVLLQTKFVGISILGKLAAGSIFAGRYVRTDGTNGILAFGRPFVERPTRVRAVLSYKTADIDYTTSEFSDLKGRPDTCIVWCALSDADEPFEIRTNPKNRQLFDRNAPDVIAYGEYTSGADTPGFITVDIPLDYNSRSRVPKMILLTAAASKYGDYFTGGAGAVMTLFSYELLYD
ncbi:MAG: PCMD domain-containing protein [Clostridium sp.]|nr:PCMD domain-containing protein [Clostridium sp.]